jgi:molybdate transport system substrate-binding protein
MSHPLSLLRRALLVLACAAAAGAHAGPGELTVVSEPSMKGVLTAAAKRFEQETGQHVALLIVRPNQFASAFRGTDHPDVAVLRSELMEGAVRAGQVQADSRKPMGRVGLAVVVKSGAPKPDVSTQAALTKALAGARSVVYGEPADHPGGRQAAEVIARIGLTETLKDRALVAAGANPLAQVSLGAAEIGLHAMPDALEASGVALVGPVPAELQPWTRYDMALTAEAPNLSEARRLLEYLAGSSGQAVLREKGVSSAP